MPRALKYILIAEIILGVLWTIPASMVTGSGGLALVGPLLIIYPLFGVFFLIALWAFWKHPAERKRAAWIMALPFVFWFLPMIIRGATGGALSGQQFMMLLAPLAIAALATCVFAPHKAVAVVPKFLLQSRVFNALVFIAVLLGWLFIALVVVWVASGNAKSGYQGDTGYGAGYAIVLASLYMVGLGIGSVLALIWGWLGLRGGIEDAPRKWHVAQIVISVPGVVIGAMVLGWLADQGLAG